MLPTIQQIREANGGLSNLTDYEIAQHQYQQYQQYYPDFNAFAKDIGVSTGSKWSNRVSSSIDSYQAGLAGVAEALTGSETMAGIRRDNERSARNAQQFARSQGAVMSMDDIHGVGDAADWVGGLAIDSGPYMVESLAGGMLARGLSSGTRAVAQAGRVAGATDEAIAASRAAERALATRSTIGGVVASYPSSVGDILQNQREEGDATDVGSALVGGVPYAALNAFGLEGAAARGKTLRRGLDLLNDTLDGAQGVRGALARTGVNAIKNAIPEGLSEAGQEVINQGFGRMAVNPDQTLFNDDANQRYLESFVGGAALGGAASAVGGGWRRSEGYQAPIDVTGGKDLMNAGGVPQGRTQAPQFDPTSNIVADAGLSMQDVINRNVGLDLSRKPVDPKEYGKAFEQAASEPSGVVGVDPETGHERVLTQAEYLEREAAAQNEAFAKSLEEDKLRVAERLKARAEAEELGIKGSKALDTYLELKQALQDGVIKEGSFREARVQLAERKIQQVKNFLKGAHLQYETQQEHQAAVQAADIAAVQKGATSASNAVATAAVGPAVAGGNAVDAAPSGATGVAVLPASGVRPAAPAQRVGKQAVPVLAGGATSAAVADISEVAKGKTVTVQNSKKEAELTPEQLAKKLAAASPLDKMRILAVTGMDITADPTTGKPRLVFVGNPMTYDQVAEEESKRTGKKVSREAIRKALAKFGINEDVITSFVSSSQPAAVTSEELGIPARGDDEASGAATGFRVEDDFSKAAGQGLVNDDNSADTKRNRELKAEADKLLKDSVGAKTTDVVDARAELAAREHAEAAARDEAERLTNKNTKDILENHPERKNAAADWGSERVAWDKLPDQLKADWIEDYDKVLGEFEGELNQDAFRILDAYQANIEDEYDDYIKYKGEQAATGTTEAGVARVEGSDGAASAVPQGEPRTGGDRAAGKGAGEAEPAGANTSVEDQRVAQATAAKVAVVTKKKRTVQKPVAAESSPEDDANHKAAYEASIAKFSVARSPAASTSDTVLSEITDLMPLNKSKVMIVQSISQLPRFAQQSLAEEGPQGKKVQAFVLNGKAYLVADNIKPGSARAVFLHEVGVHMGLENLLTGKEFLRLVGKIRSWAESDGSLESEIAKRAVNRVTNANTQDEQVLSELIAYFVEEAVNAGVDPTALEYKSDMGRWMRALISALKAGLAKLGLVNAKGLTAQDVVDMAYGAAHLEMQSDDRVDDGSGDVQMSVAEQLGPQYAKAESVIKQAIGDIKTAAVKYGAFTRDLIEQASKYLPSATSYLRNYETVTTERIRMEKEVDGILEKFAALNSHERAQVNNLIRESTMKREWAYTHDGMTEEEVKAFNRTSPLASAFRALTPAQQDVIKLVFTHGEKTLEAMQDAVMENVNTEFDVLIAGFKSAGNEEEAAKAEARKKAALQDFKSLLSINGKWPYAPLRRFGDHVLVAKSAAYVEAERNGDAGAIRSMEADENHYYVEFFESRGEARSARERLANSGKYEGGLVENFNKGEVSEHLYGGRDMFNAFRRLRDLVNESADTSLSSNSKGAINSLMNDLYLSLLGERSARQSERNRKNTAGADRDMMRAFATKGRADAHFIASLRTGGKVQEDLLRMKSEADRGSVGTRELRREFYNEILARHMMSLEFKSTPTLDKAMAATSFWQLVTSPAYYLQNVTQPWVMSLPMLAGKHGYGKSWAYLSRAYRDLMPLLKDGQFTEDDYDKLPPDVRSAVKELADRGRIEITLEHDLGNWRSNDGDSKVKQVWAGVVGKLRSVNQTVEMVNRLATAVAAVRLEGGTKAAVDYADRVIVATHGDYNAFNAPRTMRTPLGRLATQFRKFQLIQITMYAKLISDAFKGASAAERAVARRALAFNLGHMAVLGGAMGMPGFQLFSTILGKLFGDDDEPDDAEATMRRMLPDGPVADLLIKGVPKMLGVDVSGKVGSGNMLSLFPDADWNATSQSGMTNLIMAALGPFVGGLLPKWADGVGTVASGDVYKGMEKLLPSVLSNAIKSTRFMTEGVTTKGGDTVMSPDEITWVDGISQLIGLPTNKLTDRSFLASAKYKADKFFDERSNEIKKDYVKAYRSGDADGMKDARDAWDDMQASRVNLGYARQPLSNLLRAPRAQQKREQEAVAGVATRRKDAGFIKKLEGE